MTVLQLGRIDELRLGGAVRCNEQLVFNQLAAATAAVSHDVFGLTESF